MRQLARPPRHRFEPAWLTALVQGDGGGIQPPPPLPSGQLFLSAASIEEHVRAMPCYFPAPADTHPADDLYIDVAQVVPFDALVRCIRRLPSQQAYVREYWRFNAQPIARYPGATRRALACRVARAWASYVSELHFAALVIESGRWAACYRSVDDDARSGVDLHLRDDHEHEGAVALYVDSPSGRGYRQRKRRAPSHLPLFEVPLPLDEPHRAGAIHLYRAEDVQQLWGRWGGHTWGGCAAPTDAFPIGTPPVQDQTAGRRTVQAALPLAW